jgi:hypothetical protein
LTLSLGKDLNKIYGIDEILQKINKSIKTIEEEDPLVGR